MNDRTDTFGPAGHPHQSPTRRYFSPPNTYYGFNESYGIRFQRGKRWGSPGRRRGHFRGGGRPPRHGNDLQGTAPHLKRDRSTMEKSKEGEGTIVNFSPAEKVMRFQHSTFHEVKQIARKYVKKHRKATQDVKLPPGIVDATLPTFEAQALDLISKMELNDELKRGVQQVLLDVTEILRTVIEDIDPVVYGSMCTGLALGTSDIDCYMESKVVPDGAERMALLLKNRKVLFKSRKFDCIVGIPRARVPILKACHVETGIEVDLNCTTSSGIHNSALIKYLVHLDDRIRQLIMLIQTFYRSCKISGTNKVTSYAVTLLVLYYFQRLEQPMIPPLYKILFVGEGQTWPASFERSVGNYIDLTQNKMSLTDLFSGYFKFYANFDFTQVISLYLGREIDVSCFTPDYSNLPGELVILKSHLQSTDAHKQGFLNKHMMVQDPIEHHLNSTWNVPRSCFELFNSLNQTYWKMTTDKPETEWLANMISDTTAAQLNKDKMAVQIPIDPAMASPQVLEIKLQKFPPVMFKVPYPLEGSDFTWPEQLIPDFASVFSLLLIEHSVEGGVGGSDKIEFNLETHYNVFKTRFKNLHTEVVANPAKYDSIKTEMTVIKDRMKKPEASFCATLTITRTDTPNELSINIQDRNKNAQNVFTHLATNVKHILSSLLTAVRTLRSQTNK